MDIVINEFDTLIRCLTLTGNSCESLSFCDATPDDVKAYLEQLPHNNPADLCNRLYTLLPEIAGLQVAPGRKLALLDLARPEVMDSVRRLTQNVTITPATTKLLSLCIALLKRLAEGYKGVLVNTFQASACPPSITVSAIYSSINILTQILLESWQFYILPPKGTWRELHALYRIARLSNLEMVSIRSHRITSGVEATIRAAYVKPLLCACADPARYAPADLRQIMTFLTTAGNLVGFDDSHSDGLFLIDQDSDKGPQYSFKVHGITSRPYRMHTDRLVALIEERLASSTLSGIPPRLARDLCKYWSKEIKRRQEPTTDSSPVSLVIGLGQIHRRLTDTANVEEFLRHIRKGRRDLDLSVMELSDNKDPRDTFLKDRRLDPASNPKDKSINYESPEEARKARVLEATRMNFTDHGTALEFRTQGEMLSAGELIAFQVEGDSEWELGVVRWTRITPQLVRKIGIELYDEGFSPCVVSQLTRASKGERQYYPGLLVYARDNTTVLVSALPFRDYSHVTVEDQHGRRDAQLLTPMEETYHIARYKFQTSREAGPEDT